MVWLEMPSATNGRPNENPCNAEINPGMDTTLLDAFTSWTRNNRVRIIALCPHYYTRHGTPQLPGDTGNGRALVDAQSRWGTLLHEMMHLHTAESKSGAVAWPGDPYANAILS